MDTNKACVPLKRLLLAFMLVSLSTYTTLNPTASPRLPFISSHPIPSQVSLNANDNPSFSHLSTHCSHLTPLPAASVHSHILQLAQALDALHASAYIVEPGASAHYFFNVSQEDWPLSDRPFLLIVTPETHGKARQVRAKLTVLSPSFEIARAKLLHIPIPPTTTLAWLRWPEDANPYELVARAIWRTTGVKRAIYIDPMMRHFVADGLQKAAGSSVQVLTAPDKIRKIRERKGADEIELLKCANEVTLLAIREVRQYVRTGMRESQVQSLMLSALSAAGLASPTATVLFGPNAATPRQSSTDRELGEEDLIVVDCGGRLHGYWSDVARTYALPESNISPAHLAMWQHVLFAQTLASFSAVQGVRAGAVDTAARGYFADAGLGELKHRLGHGIGLERHETPYIRAGSDELLQPGHVFSNGPGVYVEGEVGVRLKDGFYVNAQGWPIWFTAGMGGQAQSALEP